MTVVHYATQPSALHFTCNNHIKLCYNNGCALQVIIYNPYTDTVSQIYNYIVRLTLCMSVSTNMLCFTSFLNLYPLGLVLLSASDRGSAPDPNISCGGHYSVSYILHRLAFLSSSASCVLIVARIVDDCCVPPAGHSGSTLAHVYQQHA